MNDIEQSLLRNDLSKRAVHFVLTRQRRQILICWSRQCVFARTALSDSSFFWVYVQIPIDATILAVALLKPLVAFGEMMTLELGTISTCTVVGELEQ
jgi:hypothetical protein